MLTLYESYAKCEIPKKFENEIYDDSGKIDMLNNLSKVNVFLGSNNSGKSHFIRELLRRDPLNCFYSDNKIEELKSILLVGLNQIEKLLKIYGIPDLDFTVKHLYNQNGYGTSLRINEIKSTIFTVPNYEIEALINTLAAFPKSTQLIQQTEIRNLSVYNHRGQHYEKPIGQELYDWVSKINREIVNITTRLKHKLFFKSNYCSRIYIPSTRTLRGFAKKIDVENETRKEYNFRENIFIENGQNLYSEINNLRNNAATKERKKLSDFELFLGRYFFQGNKVELITPPAGENSLNTLYIKIGDEMDQPIHDLGDGLQMILLLTFPFFLYEAGHIAIEEPELFIHPGLQKQLVDFYLNHERTKQFQIFISTHSNHIIDSINSSDKISLFSVKKKFKDEDTSNEKLPDFIINNVAYGNDNIFSSLGISNTSVYLSNCVIWVEGVTDRLYLNKFIKSYLESNKILKRHECFLNYQEGIHYSFAYTAGDSIVHWDFNEDALYSDETTKIITRRFCGKAMVIVDNDFKKNPKRKKAMKELLGDRLIELKVPEIENLLNQEVIKQTVLEYPSCNSISINELPILTDKQIKDNKAGTLIDKYLLKKYNNTKKFAKAEFSGKTYSIRAQDKVEFCKRSLKYINKDNLTKDSTDLVKVILNFIIDHNKYI